MSLCCIGYMVYTCTFFMKLFLQLGEYHQHLFVCELFTLWNISILIFLAETPLRIFFVYLC